MWRRLKEAACTCRASLSDLLTAFASCSSQQVLWASGRVSRHSPDSQKDSMGLQLGKLAVTEWVIRVSTGAPGALCGEGNAETLFQFGVREVVLRKWRKKGDT